MQLTLVTLGILLAYSCSCCAENTPADKPTLKPDGLNLRKQGVFAEETTVNPNEQSVKSSTTPEQDTKKDETKDTKGDSGQFSVVKQENVKTTEDAKSGINDDLQYLSAAQVNNGGNQEGQKETTKDDDHTEDVNEEQNGAEDMENETEEEEGDENEEDEDSAAPLDKKNKKEIILGRGVGSLADMMFQYATVSSIARSSKRRPIFSAAFTPLLTLFPKAPIVTIEDEEIVELQPLTNITLSDTQISFDSVKQDIPDHGSVEIVGQTRSWKYFHVVLDNMRLELSPAEFYTEAADDYLEEVMRRALKNKLKEEKNTNTEENNKETEKDENKVINDKGFLKYEESKNKQDDTKKDKELKSKEETTRSKEEEPKSIIEQMKSPGDEITLVGIHISSKFVGGEENEKERKEKERAVLDYFHNAMSYYRDEHSISGDYVQFVIVCEHLRWCIDHLNGPGVHFAIGGSPELDMSILARCDHSVLTPSSLSWWSSWFAGGQVVYPASLNQMNGVSIEDYVFPDWTEI